jgi:PKD repeat protein
MRYCLRVVFQLVVLVVSFADLSGQVTANFTTPSNTGCPNPFLAVVNDASTSTAGTIVSWSWEMTGPPGFIPVTAITDQLAAPLTIPGFYNVTLTACDNLGNCDTRTINNYIEIFEIPTIAYTFSPAAGCSPLEVCFDGTISPGCGTIQSSLFDLRDGNIVSNQTDFCHTYINQGTYTNFVISVTNSCGCVASLTLTDVIEVTARPVASFSATETSSCTPPLTTTISSTSTSLPGSTFTWNIPGFATGLTGPSITETFPEGSYDVELIVEDPNGCIDVLNIPNYIVVGNPVADFTFDTNEVCQGETVTFTDESSGNPVSWQWTVAGLGTSGNQNPTFTFNNPGTYDVSLLITAAGGCTDSVFFANLITVNELPVNQFVVSDNFSCSAPFTTTFTSTSLNSATTEWTFPGGNPADFTGSGPVDVTYGAPGIYGITMRDISLDGCIAQTTFNNVIEVDQLVVGIVTDVFNGCVPLPVNYQYVLNLPETVVSVLWDLPGSSLGASTDDSPSVTYDAEGCYEASVTVETASGCVASITIPGIVCAGTPPTSSFIYTPGFACFDDEEICFTYTGFGADSIFWDFGDGSGPQITDGVTPICRVYNTDLGVFTVTMAPFNNGCPGDVTVEVDAVEIFGPIAAIRDSFDCSNQFEHFFFNNSIEYDSVYWEFGDPLAGGADNSSLDNPIWTYSDFGNYTVRLTAYNFTTGCEHEATV